MVCVEMMKSGTVMEGVEMGEGVEIMEGMEMTEEMEKLGAFYAKAGAVLRTPAALAAWVEDRTGVRFTSVWALSVLCCEASSVWWVT